MKKWSLFTVIFMMILVLAACGGAKETTSNAAEEESKPAEKEEVTVTSEFGEVTIAKNPEKVVVFDFGVLDTLDSLEVDVVGLPQATVPANLEKYKSSDYTNVGSLKEPDFEAIHTLKPDVIFISGRQSELYDQFAEIAPTVFMDFDYTDYMGSVEKNVNLLAEIFEKEDVAAKELDELQASVNELNKAASGLEDKALVLLANEGKVSAYGPSSRYGFVHDVFGFKAADENIEVSQHGQSITFEYILEKNPDVIFVIDRSAAVGGQVGAKEALENDLVKKTTAYQNNKIIYLDGVTWYIGGNGLQSTQVMVDEVKEALGL